MNDRRPAAGRRGRSKLAAALAVVAAVALALGLAADAMAAGGVPEKIKAPEITGGLAVGDTLSCSNGEWTGEPGTEPTTFTYSWLRDGTPIEDATENSYKLQTADEGQSLTCDVTAENTAGPSQQPATSAPVVVPVVPVNTGAPGLTGLTYSPLLRAELALVGHSLSCSTGSWTHEPVTFTYRWLRKSAVTESAITIEGATKNSYEVQAADDGYHLMCEVTATTSTGGSSSATSSAAEVAIVGVGQPGGGGQGPTGGPPSEDETPSGGGPSSVGNTGTKTSSDTKISYSVAARSGVVFVKLDCVSAANECPSVTVQLSIVVVEHLRSGRVTAVTATRKIATNRKGATGKRTVVIGRIAVKLVGGSKTVEVPLNAAGRTLERQRKAFAAQVRLTSDGRVVAAEDVQIKRAASRAKKTSSKKAEGSKRG